jgi:SAM-dependent methyltransferase
MDMIDRRANLSQCLFGSGIELGPGHNPFPLKHRGITVRYVDRWEPDTNSELFPELGEDAAFPVPDIISNLDTDRLGVIPDASVDFVIASHVLEHMAEPLGLLQDIYRVVRPGGVLLILLPDRHLTFDRLRNPTSLEHLVAEYEAGVDEVDDAHIEEFVLATAPVDEPRTRFLSDDPDERRRQIDVHRRRSVHAHCWDQGEFAEVLRYAVRSLGEGWELTDALLTAEGGPESIEYGFVLRKSIADLGADVMGDRFDSAWRSWRDQHEAALERGRMWEEQVRAQDELVDLGHALIVKQGEVEVLKAELAAARIELSDLRMTKTFRYTELGRRAYGRLVR